MEHCSEEDAALYRDAHEALPPAARATLLLLLWLLYQQKLEEATGAVTRHVPDTPPLLTARHGKSRHARDAPKPHPRHASKPLATSPAAADGAVAPRGRAAGASSHISPYLPISRGRAAGAGPPRPLRRSILSEATCPSGRDLAEI